MRDLDWTGCWNARDLGGLRARSGARTQPGRLVRSEALHRLTREDWDAALAHGVRTVIDLRNPDQTALAPSQPPAGVELVSMPLEDGLAADPAFVPLMTTGAWATAHYLAAFLQGWPERVAAVLQRIAAAPGGVLFHCAKGSDRTGVIALALLALADVEPDDIAADYERTAVRLRERGAALGCEDDAPALQRVYARLGSTPRECVLAALQAMPLAEARLGADDAARLRQRLLAP